MAKLVAVPSPGAVDASAAIGHAPRATAETAMSEIVRRRVSWLN
jgi:hypothetical protein